MSAIRIGYIRDFRTDVFWFLALPFVAIATGLACQKWLPFVAVASVQLWVTVPHHFASWARTYGLSDDWQRFKSRLIIGPVVIIAMTVAGLAWAPLTIAIVAVLWDQQHSIMQQHGLARIYDFKARAGSPWTGKFDLWLGIVLFTNMMVTSPMWSETWILGLYHWDFPVTAETVRSIHSVSWGITIAYVAVYVTHILWCLGKGYSLNPVKYLFIFSSYALWYYAAWHTNSLLVFGVAHRIMHGLQYILIVYWYMERKEERTGHHAWMIPKLSMSRFAMMGLLYALAYQLLLLQPLDQFGFGFVSWTNASGAAADISMPASRVYDIYAATLINGAALIHYYVDSFIWKVSDVKTQEGL